MIQAVAIAACVLTLGAVLFERLSNRTHRLPTVKVSDAFPYQIENGMCAVHSLTHLFECLVPTGSACFVCKSGESMRDPQTNDERCHLCPEMHTNHFNGPELLLHMGAHILHDSRMKDANNPCGLCLNLGSLCTIRLVRRGRSGDQTNMVNSRCPNLHKISLKHAAKFSKMSPCTNTPKRCPLCPKVSDAIWKYNIRSHVANVHGGDISLYQDLYTISNEESVLMKAVFLSKPWKTKRKKPAQNLKISEAHSTRVALRYVPYIREHTKLTAI